MAISFFGRLAEAMPLSNFAGWDSALSLSLCGESFSYSPVNFWLKFQPSIWITYDLEQLFLYSLFYYLFKFFYGHTRD